MDIPSAPMDRTDGPTPVGNSNIWGAVAKSVDTLSSAPPLVPVDRTGTLPLSFAQNRLWFLEQAEPGNITYNLPFAWRLSGKLNVPALQQAFNAMVQRHEAFRTHFPTSQGVPNQVIAATGAVEMAVHDLTGAADQEQELHRLMRLQTREPFHLETSALLRVSLFRLKEDEHALLVVMHHIICDGMSLRVVFRELPLFYQGAVTGTPVVLPELTIHYADYAVWEQTWFKSNAPVEAMCYWKNQLGGRLPVLDLPADRPRPIRQSLQGASFFFDLPDGLVRALGDFRKREGVTMFACLMAAFKALLFRYTGQEDLLVGAPVANRSATGLEGIIGFFVNTVVIRSSLSGNLSFRELLTQVKRLSLEAFQYQEVPFERVVEELNPERTSSASPIFQVMFAFQGFPRKPLAFPGLKTQRINIDPQTSKFDLTMNINEIGRQIVADIEYCTDLFDPETIERMARHYEILLTAAIAEPDRPIGQLPLLTRQERQRILVDWNCARKDFPPPRTIHQFFEAQVQRSPDAIALVHGNERLTYSQLNQKANQLAHSLKELGVEAEILVGICAERTPLMVIGLLAILKAGGAYVPLDPAYPKERLDFILKDTCAPVLLTTHRLAAKLPATSARVVWLDEPVANSSQENLPSCVTEKNLAYIIYTSGSTGRPKGVAIEHRNSAALINWAREIYTDEERSGVLAATSLCFDLSIFELFATLSWGGKIILADNVLQVPDLPAAREITLVNTVPSAIAELLALDAIPASVRTVNLAGEPLKTPLVQQIYQKKTISRVYDLYGPSEDTTYSTFALRRADRPATIGRPLLNKQVYILDTQREPVPVGVAGEIYIGGEGVARGYLNRAELTAEKFIQNPFSTDPESRLYRTGDLARFRSDGNIEFLGRIDHQVKIRGFRIELGEIESVLARHPGVAQAAVLAREEGSGQLQLVAYVVAKTEASLSINELREFLKASLPDYMVPSAFLHLPALPLNLNGKIDRKALLQLKLESPTSETPSFIAPSTEMEKALAKIWQEVLRRPRIGINDNFFDLGGHSLLATQVVSRIRRALHLEVSLRNFFQQPTIAQLSAILDRQTRIAESVIKTVSRDERLPLSFTQQRFWFFDQFEPGGVTYILQQCVRLSGPVEPGILERCLNEIIRRHEPLRTVFPDQGGLPCQKILSEVVIKLPLVDLRHLPEFSREAQVKQLALEESTQPVDLKQGPIFRARLLRLADQDHALVLTMHHITADGWSFSILLNEISVLYEAFLAGQPSPLPELAIQYADYAAWQREWLAGGVMKTQSDYWKKQLAEAPPLSSLPTDFPRCPHQSNRGACSSFSVEAPLLASFKRYCKSEDCTLFMGLLAVFYIVVHRYTGGQNDLLLGSPIANRNRDEIEGLIGCFINTLVLRVDLSGQPSFREVLRRVREVTLEAYAHQDLPFEKLLEEVQPARNQSYSPLFQLMFILQNTPLLAAKVGDLAFKSCEFRNGTTKFDFALVLNEEDGGLRGEVEYASDLFEEATIRRFMDHWVRLLAEVIAQPELPVGQLRLLSEQERHQLLVEWNDVRKEISGECVHEQVEKQAAATPQALAVECDGVRLTYRQLNEQSNQLAHFLRSQGIGLNTPVGICLPRSVELIVAILGILKAGGAYVPLDTDYPGERMAFMLQDSKAPLVVANLELVSSKRLDAIDTKLLCFDRDQDLLQSQSCANPSLVARPDSLIYIIYTSGSTGKPKGAGNYHRGFANQMDWYINEFKMASADHMLVVSSPSFDLTQKNIFGALMQGGSLHLLPPGFYDPDKILHLMDQWQITLINCTPSAFYPLIESADPEAFKKMQSLRCVFLGGEPISKPRVRPWVENPWCRGELDNTYGPTECSDISGFYRATRDKLDLFDFIPLGRPIPNAKLVIVDPNLGPCPIGVPGELLIGGVPVGAGYLNAPDLTASRFIESPFPEIPNTRFYKTGDLARIHANGLIEYLGRLDHQVKIRGFRIELGEIESVMLQYPAIQEAVVIAAGQETQKWLAAYYVLEEKGQTPDLAELRDFMRQKLPDYMVPAAFLQMEKIPLTTSGKIDRKALPTPEKAFLQAKPVLPRTPLEKEVAQVWCEVLQLDEVGVNDNFFELGGHSLLATQVISRLQPKYPKVNLQDLFDAPTIAEICERIEARMINPPQDTPPLVALGRNRKDAG